MQAGGKQVSKTFWRRLTWRDLAHWQLHHFPDMSTKPIRSHYADQVGSRLLSQVFPGVSHFIILFIISYLNYKLRQCRGVLSRARSCHQLICGWKMSASVPGTRAKVHATLSLVAG